MAPKKAKKELKEESDESEDEPLVRDSKKIVKKKPSPQPKEKKELPKKAIPEKVQKSKPAPKKSKAQAKPKDTRTKEETKKNYLPGQRHPTLPDTDGAKAFYLSLLEQCPDNAMAEKWCLDYGCLDYDDALERIKKYEKNKK